MFDVGFVVGLDIVEIVEIIHHEAGAIVLAFGRGIAQPADIFDAGAVAEVEAGNRFDRATRTVLGFEQIFRRFVM